MYSYRRRYYRRRWRKRPAKPKRFKRRYKPHLYKRTKRNINRQQRIIKRTSIPRLYQLPNANSIIRKFSVITHFTFTQSSLKNAKGTILDDFKVSQFIDDANGTYYKSHYVSCNILGAVITWFIASTDGLTQLEKTGVTLTDYYQTQLTDTSKHPRVLVHTAYSATVQNALANLNNESNDIDRRWASVPHTQTLTQKNKYTRRWKLPPSIISETHATNMLNPGINISQILGAILPNNHPHGYVMCFRDIGQYPEEMSITFGLRVDSTFLFQNRLPDT